jgi:hypothetical protein
MGNLTLEIHVLIQKCGLATCDPSYMEASVSECMMDVGVWVQYTARGGVSGWIYEGHCAGAIDIVLVSKARGEEICH